ncbi:MAG: hypothetical protein KBE04_08205 [Phycisphaerae bacterium]|nr:hypothetical protein [Phycisphaerae bacterium]
MDRRLQAMQQTALDRMSAQQCADIHCHCLPGLDDGPRNTQEALALCEALVEDGITTVVATPHQLGRFDGRCDARSIKEAVAQLNADLSLAGIPLEVLPGAEVRVDERLLDLLAQDKVQTLPGDCLMLELPFEVFLDVGPLLRALGEAGIRTVIAHPERNAGIAADPARCLAWSDSDPVLQVTAASLVGALGPGVREAAWRLLDLPMTAVVATDAHDTGDRSPCFAGAFGAVRQKKGIRFAKQVFVDNPWHVVGAGSARKTLSRG